MAWCAMDIMGSTCGLDMYQPVHYNPIFGPEIRCPHCRQNIQALTLTDTYLCPRHGAFEADPKTECLVHLQSERSWRLWNEEWYRQHTHPDGIRFEIHEELDRLHTQGYRAIKLIIARRYRDLIWSYLERAGGWRKEENGYRLYGLPVEFSPETSEEALDPETPLPEKEPSPWNVINFELEKEPGPPLRYPYFRLFG
jgi:uncharacterized protein (TIGR02652 family)